MIRTVYANDKPIRTITQYEHDAMIRYNLYAAFLAALVIDGGAKVEVR